MFEGVVLVKSSCQAYREQHDIEFVLALDQAFSYASEFLLDPEITMPVFIVLDEAGIITHVTHSETPELTELDAAVQAALDRTCAEP